MATVYNVMLYGGLALAIVFAIVAVVLFFVLKIPKAVGIATGSTARKKIDEIKEKGYESVQGGGASKQEAIKNHTSRISVRDVKSTAAEKHSEKGMANYEKAIADLGKKRLEDEGETATDILRDDAEEATDILRVLISMAAALRRRQTSSEKMRMRKQRMYSEMTRQTRKQRTYSEAMTQTRKQRMYLEAMTQMIPQPFFREDAQ